MNPALFSLPGPSNYQTYSQPTSNSHSKASSSIPPSGAGQGQGQGQKRRIDYDSGNGHDGSTYSLEGNGKRNGAHGIDRSQGNYDGQRVQGGLDTQGEVDLDDIGDENGTEVEADTTGAGGVAEGEGIQTGPMVEPHQDLNDFLESFWMRQMDTVEKEDHGDGKSNVSLPLARIKKVMKSDEEVKMISAEVPIMFSKACEIFIAELTCRAWLVAESHKRRTLQKSDVAAAIAFSDMFDFLIDIIPREGEGEDDNPDAGQGAQTADPSENGQPSRDHTDEQDPEPEGTGGNVERGEADDDEELYREFVED